MLAVRLIQLIETHADRLSEGLTRKLSKSEECSQLLSFVPAHELKHRAYEIYRNLSEWLISKTESEIEERYIGLGARRAHQQVPFSQLLFAIHATKEYLWEYLREEGLLEPTELLGEMDLLHSMERFFDRALYFAAIGDESARSGEAVHHLTKHAHQ
jgi:hypothetical protein